MKVNSMKKQQGFLSGVLSLSAIKSFFQFSNISVYLIIGLVLVYGYYRITLLESQKETLEEKNGNLVEKVEERTEKYNDLVIDVEQFKKEVNENLAQQRRINEDLSNERIKNREKLSDLRSKFNETSGGKQRDFENLAREKPNLIEKRINDATRELGNEIEQITRNRDKSKEKSVSNSNNKENDEG